MKTRKALYLILILGGLYYLVDAMDNMFLSFGRLHFDVFGYNIGRIPYVIYELFIAATLLYLGFTQLKSTKES
jgi:hypothetical protein